MAKKKKTAKEKLNPKQRLFSELYATDREFFGNGVQSYIEAYNVKPTQYNTAKVNAAKLLTNANILAYINELLELRLNDVQADKQLSFLITQNAELNVKLGAIKEYNILKQRITKKIQHSLDEPTATLLGLIDGSSKGKLPTKQENDSGL